MVVFLITNNVGVLWYCKREGLGHSHWTHFDLTTKTSVAPLLIVIMLRSVLYSLSNELVVAVLEMLSLWPDLPKLEAATVNKTCASTLRKAYTSFRVNLRLYSFEVERMDWLLRRKIPFDEIRLTVPQLSVKESWRIAFKSVMQNFTCHNRSP